MCEIVRHLGPNGRLWSQSCSSLDVGDQIVAPLPNVLARLPAEDPQFSLYYSNSERE